MNESWEYISKIFIIKNDLYYDKYYNRKYNLKFSSQNIDLQNH